jgi:hypothetical protein
MNLVRDYVSETTPIQAISAVILDEQQCLFLGAGKLLITDE